MVVTWAAATIVLLHVGTLLPHYRLGEAVVQAAYVKCIPRLQVLRHLDLKHPSLGSVHLDGIAPVKVRGNRHFQHERHGRFLHFPRAGSVLLRVRAVGPSGAITLEEVKRGKVKCFPYNNAVMTVKD